jgi:hypothetical protein
MKPYTFFIKTNDPSKAILLAKQEVQSRGGVMAGGKFSVKGYAGEYKQVAGGVDIIITDKPSFMGVSVPNSVVESTVTGYFNSMGA